MHRSIAFTILGDEAGYKKDADTATEIETPSTICIECWPDQ
jgi:hypothetical protein